MLLDGGYPIISSETMKLARQNYTSICSADRALGFLYVTERYPQTGKLFKTGSYGHCGHTGQCLFVDPDSGFFSIVLSDMTRTLSNEYGRVMAARARIHNAIKEDIDNE